VQRRTFLIRSSGLMFSVGLGHARAARGDRVGMGTVIFRNRFEQTKPKGIAEISNPLTLLSVPAYYREHFGVRNLEFWSNHFESLETGYLVELRDRVQAAGCDLINVQVDAPYDLASNDEVERQRSLATVRRWIEAAALLRSRAIRINPGRAGGSVEKSIASLKVVNQECVARGLPLLTENHFGLEMNPDLHLQIREAAGPENIYTLPDFGNYPVGTMWESLEKILPYAYVVSAKAVDFNERMEHTTYDFDRCMQLCERAGFKGIYLAEQWSRREQDLDYEKTADWLLQRVRKNIVGNRS
jgi:sugar phosphate isomerase/epimerase